MALKSQGKDITVITYNDEIVNFCQNQNIYYISYNFKKISSLTFYRLLFLKNTLNRIIKNINLSKDDIFIFVGNKTKAYDAFYLEKELSKKGKVYIKILSIEFKKYKRPKKRPFFRGDILRLGIRTILGIKLVYYNLNNDPCLGIDEKFLDKYNIKEYKPKISSEKIINEGLKKIRIIDEDHENLIMLGDPTIVGEYNRDYIKMKTVIDLYKKLLDLPVNFAIKKHPNVKNDLDFYNIFKKCKELPRYMPAELFCNNIKKNMISTCSASLVTAAQCNHLKAISLADLVEWQTETRKKEIKKWLKKTSNNTIYFPQTFEELKKLILK